MKLGWLYRPENVRKLRRAGLALLAAALAAQLLVHVHGHFGFDQWFGFFALYGFVTCVAMVLFAKLLGVWLKRREDYYDD